MFSLTLAVVKVLVLAVAGLELNMSVFLGLMFYEQFIPEFDGPAVHPYLVGLHDVVVRLSGGNDVNFLLPLAIDVFLDDYLGIDQELVNCYSAFLG